MALHILHGNDDDALQARLAEICAGLTRERVDCSADAGASLAAAAQTQGLFGGQRAIVAENLSSAAPAAIRAAAGTEAVVVALLERAPSKAMLTACAGATVERHDLPKPGQVPSRISAMALQSGVTLDRDSQRLLVERGRDDLSRVRSVLRCLCIAGIDKPNVAQVASLLGSTQAQARPWDTVDALERGDLRASIEAASSMEAIALHGYLASRARQNENSSPSALAAIARSDRRIKFGPAGPALIALLVRLLRR